LGEDVTARGVVRDLGCECGSSQDTKKKDSTETSDDHVSTLNFVLTS
jgi:hypothetical protein